MPGSRISSVPPGHLALSRQASQVVLVGSNEKEPRMHMTHLLFEVISPGMHFLKVTGMVIRSPRFLRKSSLFAAGISVTTSELFIAVD